jgi:hypothetical protein
MRTLLSLLVLAGILAGCAGSGYHEVHDSNDGANDKLKDRPLQR